MKSESIKGGGLPPPFFLTMQIREMKIEELAGVIDLHLEGLEQELVLLNRIFPGKSMDRGGREQLARLLTQVLHAGEGRIFVAVDGTVPVGYCLVTKKIYPVEIPRLCGCVNGLYVRENYRRQKTGSKLFEESMAWLKKEGVGYVELYHMLNDPRATEFWKRMGFTPVQWNCVKKI